jgi:ureidoacrylate peracid hydrolase
MTVTLERLVDPRTAALVVVDMQNDFCHPDGAEAARGADVRLAAPMAQRLKALLAEARAGCLRTIFVRTHHSPWTNSEVWLGRGGGRHADSNVPLCLPGTWGSDFYDGLEPRRSADCSPETSDFVVTKHRYSGFVGTDLELVLRSQALTTLIMTGTASNGCVEATARDGFHRDLAIVYVSDCSVASTEARHEECLERVRSWAAVVTADELVRAWRSIRPHTKADRDPLAPGT